jgi:hypothetical protein
MDWRYRLSQVVLATFLLVCGFIWWYNDNHLCENVEIPVRCSK